MPIVFANDTESITQEVKVEDEAPPVLEPDHPLLDKFQQSLKEHLLKQIEMLKNDVFELETGNKKKSVQCDQLGMEAYEAQQLINQQHNDLEQRVLELDKICTVTEEMERELEEDKKSLESKRVEVFEAEKRDLRLCKELEGLNALLQQMKQWEADIESELTINQRVFEKTKKDKHKLADEKRQLDMLVYKLMSEVWRLEEELETLDMQLRVKEDEREKLAEAVIASNIDIDGIHTELKCIVHSWNSVVVATSQRDRHYNAIRAESEKLSEKLNTMHSEIRKLKNMCTKETIQNQRLTEIKERINTDVENTKILLDAEVNKRDTLEVVMSEKQTLLNQVENDCKAIDAETANKNAEHSSMVKAFEKVSRQKKYLEIEMLNVLDQQMTKNRAAQYLNKVVHQAQEKNRNLAIMLAKLENTQAKALLDIESQKCLNEEINRFLQEVVQQQRSIDSDLRKRTAELEKLRVAMSRRQKDSNVLGNKIEAAINKAGGEAISPEEIKIRTLETNIGEIREYIKSQQKFWLRQQGHIVGLSEQRQQQICDIDILKKQLLLLVQKNLRVTDELDTYNTENNKIDRSVAKLHTALLRYNEKLDDTKENKDVIGKANDILHQQYLTKLEEKELDCLRIESDITDIEEDKVNLSKDLVEFNREALTWERKVQMIVEAKKSMDLEQGKEGEVSKMKSEIHRMEVRFSQLSCAQDKLIHDLNFCISRRECILITSSARQKLGKGGVDKVRINFQRKLDDVRNQAKQTENEIKELDNKTEELNHEQRELTDEIDGTNTYFNRTRRQMQVTTDKIVKCKIDKQMKLDLLVLKQKKLKVYSELAKDRLPYIPYKTENAISAECNKQQDLNKTFLTIINNLLSTFPEHVNALIMVSNTIKLPLMQV